MANIKSAEKRIDVNEKKRQQNRSQKSAINTDIKKFKAAVAAKEFKLADELYNVVTSSLDNGAQDGVLHKNKADRNKAKLAKLLSDAKAKKK